VKSFLAAKNCFVRAICRFVRANFHSVRRFSVLCGCFPIRADNLPFRAGQLPVSAAISASVRAFFDSCGEKPCFFGGWRIWCGSRRESALIYAWKSGGGPGNRNDFFSTKF